MANDRTQQQTLIDGLTPVVELSELKSALVQDGYIFKKDVIDTVTVSGGLATADFSGGEDQIIIDNTAGGDATITITGLENGQKANLIVKKTNSDVITFSGVTRTVVGRQNGRLTLVYSVEKQDTTTFLLRKNKQESGTLSIGDFSMVGIGSIDSVDYFNWYINDNVCVFNGKLTYSPLILGNLTEFTVSNWGVIPLEDYFSINVYCDDSSVAGLVSSGIFDYNNSKFTIRSNDAVDNGDTVVVYFDGSFIVQ